jgi:two-component system chemotaxis response regulator CheY
MATILLVDDAAFMRTRCAKLLRDSGFEVVEAENGVEAVRTYISIRPDAVLMDVIMPEMDGLAALKEIRRLDPSARVTMVTAMGQEDMVLDALKSGAKNYLLKPFQPDRIIEAVRKMLG